MDERCNCGSYSDLAKRHWPVIVDRLKTGNYQPGAIRGVSLPKPQGGERRLGIPNVQDRLIQQALSQVRGHWDAQSSSKLEERIKHWQQTIRGWTNYFKICQQWRKVKILES